MKNNTLDSCRSLVLLERLLYLKNIIPQDLETTNFLDRHRHQTILRLLYEQNKENFYDKLQLYCLSYEERLKTLNKVLLHIEKKLSQSSLQYKNVDNNLINNRKKITKEFENIIKNSSLNKELFFANKFGFAIFPDLKIENTTYGLSCKIPSSEFSSVGGLMYYGFNISSSQVYYYQMLPIKVLAAVLYSYARESPYNSIDADWWVNCARIDMFSLSQKFKNYNAILKLTLEVLELHEQGHSFCVNGDKTMYHFLKSIGIKDRDLYITDFASEKDLKSWERIKSGIGTSKDICFILGDFLANISTLLAGIEEPLIVVMRAFNWGILTAPALNKMPRGKISFIRYSIDKNFDDLFLKLEKIFFLVKNEPIKVPQVLQEMDLESWAKVQEYYNVT